MEIVVSNDDCERTIMSDDNAAVGVDFDDGGEEAEEIDGVI